MGSIMDQCEDDLGRNALSGVKWHCLDGVFAFLCAPHECMERLSVDHKPMLDLVPMCITLLIQHCTDGEDKLAHFGIKLEEDFMKGKLSKHKCQLVQELTRKALYLNLQIPKPSNANEPKPLIDLVRETMQFHYSAELSTAPDDASLNVDITTLLAWILHPSCGADATIDEIEKYLSMGSVQSKGFFKVLSWWLARQALLPAHCQMVMNYLRMSTASKPSELVNSAASHEFTCSWESLLSSVFVTMMWVRLWMRAGMINISRN